MIELHQISLFIRPVAIDSVLGSSPTSIARGKTFELDVRSKRLVVEDVMRDVGAKLPEIRLACEEKVVLRVFRELLEELCQRQGICRGLAAIIIGACGCTTATDALRVAIGTSSQKIITARRRLQYSMLATLFHA